VAGDQHALRLARLAPKQHAGDMPPIGVLGKFPRFGDRMGSDFTKRQIIIGAAPMIVATVLTVLGTYYTMQRYAFYTMQRYAFDSSDPLYQQGGLKPSQTNQ
jgi:hypothetical protein